MLCCTTIVAVAAVTTIHFWLQTAAVCHWLKAQAGCNQVCMHETRVHSLACCEACHEVCNQVLTEGTALPCRALSPATPDWRGANLASALIAHPIRSDIIVDCVSLSFGYSHLATTRICWQVLSCMVKLS